MLVIPHTVLGRNWYISENAIQPAQVNTYWTWSDVHVADRFAEQVPEWANLAHAELVHRSYSFVHAKMGWSNRKASVVAAEFARLGLHSATQSYTYHQGNKKVR